MDRQNDWFTGIDYYHNYREKEIVIERKIIDSPTQQYMHEQVEMIYVLSGDAVVSINGRDFHAEEGNLFCMYTHHFYNIHSIKEKLDVVYVKFFIGLFMYMSWEKHPRHANARLMYDTCPMVKLFDDEKEDIERIIYKLLKENKEARFASKNMIVYKTLELHACFCRYTYEHIGINKKEENELWEIIKRVILSPSKCLELKEIAAKINCSERTLNQKIKNACGYTFYQLQQFGKILNACALFHFPELSMEYISDILGFSSTQAFYRLFVQHCKMTPREYQKKCVGSEEKDYIGTGLAMQFLQYMHLNFMHDITIDNLCDEFCIKPYTAKQLFDSVFGTNFSDILNEIRVNYAASILHTDKYSILEVSLLCGFNSLSTFQRTFKEFMNQTPSEYKRLMQ